jgi:Tfp pilus assembly protein PilF
MTKHEPSPPSRLPEIRDSVSDAPGAGSAGVGGVLRSLDVREFVRRIHLEQPGDQRFALFLGAGCSVTSGIPAAGELVTTKWLPRLRDVRAPDEPDAEQWAARALKAGGYDPNEPATSYGLVMEELFESEGDKQQEVDALCSGKAPSFAYGVLAQLVAGYGGRFNVVLTTNFDDLVEDALFYYVNMRPTVILHESLALFIRSTPTRPLVVKLHGDHRLAPRNTNLETAAIQKDIRESVANLLRDRGMIFVGYGGHDRGIVDMLTRLPEHALPFGVYWVAHREPRSEVAEWLRRRDAIWVKCESFERLMLEIMLEMDLPPSINRTRFEMVLHGYFGQLWYEKVKAECDSPDEEKRGRPFDDERKKALTAKVHQAAKELPGVSSLLTTAREFQEEGEIDKAEAKYEEALRYSPNSIEVLTSCAWFRCDVLADVEGARELLWRAAELADPDPKKNPEPPPWWGRALAGSAYGAFLSDVAGDSESALVQFQKLVEQYPADEWPYCLPDALHFDRIARWSSREKVYESAYKGVMKFRIFDAAAVLQSRWAMFVHQKGPGKDHADIEEDLRDLSVEERFRRALQLSPGNAMVLARFAVFLWESEDVPEALKRESRAETFFKRALSADPANTYNLGNYARFLCAKGQRAEGIKQARLGLKLEGRYSRSPIRLDLELCRYLHGDDRDRDEALPWISRLVSPSAPGVTATDSNLRPNFELARTKQHPGAEWFDALARVIKGPAESEARKAGLTVLQGWDSWRHAEARATEEDELRRGLGSAVPARPTD